MRTLKVIGIIVMFLGIALKVTELPGYTPAFIVGAALILSSRIYKVSHISPENN